MACVGALPGGRTTMTGVLLATVGHGTTALWYLTRSTGLVAFILLSATLVLGLVSAVGWTTERWPRFLSQSLHRNLSLFCLAVVAVHVVSTIGDGFVPIHLADVVIPFREPYRPLWVGLGALAFDLMLAVLITSGLRHRIGFARWRAVHWLAYLSWPLAAFHELGSGTDVHLPVPLVVNLVCLGAVLGTAVWRLAGAPRLEAGWRAAAVGAAVLVVVGLVSFALAGPLQPGWSRRAGTSLALLRQLSPGSPAAASTPAAASAGGTSTSHSTSPATSPAAGATPTTSPASGQLPVLPFSAAVTGSYQTSAPNRADQVAVVLSMQVEGSPPAPLTVRLIGTPVEGGVSMTSSQVTFGPESGVVTSLAGASLTATVRGSAGTMYLTLQLSLDQASQTITGTASGRSAAGGGGDR